VLGTSRQVGVPGDHDVDLAARSYVHGPALKRTTLSVRGGPAPLLIELGQEAL
jgi:hypothetical protein